MPSIMEDAIQNFFCTLGLDKNDDNTGKDDFDLGTKQLYLERAIQQDCQCFLQSVDKLYEPCISFKKIAFIKKIKFINDLFFNNKINAGDEGMQEAQVHFFKSLGEVNSQDVQKIIQEIVHKIIIEWQRNHAEKIIAQKAEREFSEARIAEHFGWRTMMDLPIEQQSDIVLALQGDISREQYQQFSEEARTVISFHIPDMRLIIQKYSLKNTNLQVLSAQELKALLGLQDSIISEYKKTGIPFVRLLDLDSKIRIELICNLSKIVKLVNVAKITFEQLLLLSPVLRAELINKAELFVSLVKMDIASQHFLPLNFTIFTQLVINIDFFHEFVKKTGITLKQLLALDLVVLTDIINNFFAVTYLINEMRISFQYVVGLPPDLRAELLDKVFEINWFMRGTGIQIERLLMLDSELRAELLIQRNKVFQLIKEQSIPIEQLLIISAQELRDIIQGRSLKEPPEIFNQIPLRFSDRRMSDERVIQPGNKSNAKPQLIGAPLKLTYV